MSPLEPVAGGILLGIVLGFAAGAWWYRVHDRARTAAAAAADTAARARRHTADRHRLLEEVRVGVVRCGLSLPGPDERPVVFARCDVALATSGITAVITSADEFTPDLTARALAAVAESASAPAGTARFDLTYPTGPHGPGCSCGGGSR